MKINNENGILVGMYHDGKRNDFMNRVRMQCTVSSVLLSL